MDSKDQNLNLTRTKWISVHFNPFSFAGRECNCSFLP